MLPQPPTSPPPPVAVSLAKLLLVEGRDVAVVAEEVLLRLGLSSSVEVRDYKAGGQDLTGPYLQAITKSAQVTINAIAVLCDAEQKPASSMFTSVCDRLAQGGLSKPGKIGVFSNSVPKIGVFVMPDCAGKGMLEDLCFAAIASDQSWAGAEKCVEDFLACGATALGGGPKNVSKARLQAILALARNKVARLPGDAAKQGVIPLTSPKFQALTEFLKAL